jgi:hypothetical protein
MAFQIGHEGLSGVPELGDGRLNAEERVEFLAWRWRGVEGLNE